MSLPNCPRCEHKVFQVTTVDPVLANYKLNITHCAKCGCAIGVTEYYNIGKLLENLAKALNVKIHS
jgi:hypothetical protein